MSQQSFLAWAGYGAAPIQDSYREASQKKGSASCNSSSSVEDSRQCKIAKLHTAATASKPVLSMHSVSQSICFLKSKHVDKH